MSRRDICCTGGHLIGQLIHCNAFISYSLTYDVEEDRRKGMFGQGGNERVPSMSEYVSGRYKINRQRQRGALNER